MNISEILCEFYPAEAIPPPPTFMCFASPSTHISKTYAILFQWNISFTMKYFIERYRVSVSPNSSCPLLISSNEIFTCSGLKPDTTYNVAISGGCRDFDGEAKSISITLPAGIFCSYTPVLMIVLLMLPCSTTN